MIALSSRNGQGFICELGGMKEKITNNNNISNNAFK